MSNTKISRRSKIHLRIRKKVSGTPERPRLAVYRSNLHIYAQLIDDLSGKTIMSVSSKDESIINTNVNKVEKSKLVGSLLAKKAIEKGIKSISFDRGGYLYHGRVKALADGARGNVSEDGVNELLQF
jgi:large subunit ribosomal protein L18